MNESNKFRITLLLLAVMMTAAVLVLAGKAVLNRAEVAEDPDKTGIFYYKGFRSNYRHPVTPVGNMSEEETLSWPHAYLKTYYESGRLMRVEKYYRGNLEYTYEYTYDENGKYKGKK